MGNDICFLITVYDGVTLLKCAIKVTADHITNECSTYPMEPENLKILSDLLPTHVKSLGKIVAVEEIFEVEVHSHD